VFRFWAAQSCQGSRKTTWEVEEDALGSSVTASRTGRPPCLSVRKRWCEARLKRRGKF